MRVREQWRRLVQKVRQRCCAHPSVEVQAATCANRLGANVEIGVVARCSRCGRCWSGDVLAGLAKTPTRCNNCC